MVTHILFDLCLFKHFSPVANFGYQSVDVDVLHRAITKFDLLSVKDFDM